MNDIAPHELKTPFHWQLTGDFAMEVTDAPTLGPTSPTTPSHPTTQCDDLASTNPELNARTLMETKCSNVGLTYPYDIEFNSEMSSKPWELWVLLDLKSSPTKATFVHDLMKLEQERYKNMGARISKELSDGEHKHPPAAFQEFADPFARQVIWDSQPNPKKHAFLVEASKEVVNGVMVRKLRKMDDAWRTHCIRVIRQAFEFYHDEQLRSKLRMNKRQAAAIMDSETSRVRRKLVKSSSNISDLSGIN